MKYTIPLIKLFFLSILIIFIPLQVNHELYRLGWESAKIKTFQWTAVWMILLSLLYLLTRELRKNIGIIKSSDHPEKANIQFPISKSHNVKRKTYNSRHLFSIIFTLLSLIAISISSLTSDIKAPVFALPNALYEKVFYWVPQNQAVLGSYFREQGLITIILIILSSLILSKALNKKLIIFILFLLTLSGFIHSIEGIRQVIEIYKLNPDLIKEGRWVFGFFGQANFFSGHLILSFISSIYLYRIVLQYKKEIYMSVNTYLQSLKRERITYYVLHITKVLTSFLLLFARSTSFLAIIAIYFSYSTWGWILMAITIPLCFRHTILKSTKVLTTKIRNPKKQILNKSEKSNIKNQNIKFGIWKLRFENLQKPLPEINVVTITAALVMLFVLGMPLAMRIIPNYLPSQASRTDFWEEISYIYITKPLRGEAPLVQMLFGTGFDTLGETYHENDKFTDRYIDRAHNLYFDILAFTGVVGLAIFTLFTFFTFKLLYRSYIPSKNNKMVIEFTAIALSILLIRATYHTHSIVNLLNLGIVYAVAWSLNRIKNLE